MKLSYFWPCILCLPLGCTQGHAAREAATPAFPPATRPAQAAKQRQGVEGFVEFCGTKGIALQPDPEEEGAFIASVPLEQDLRVRVCLAEFAAGTRAADMRTSLQVNQLAYPFLNEEAGLAMSNAHGTQIAADDVGPALMAQLAQLLRDYRPLNPRVPAGHPADTQPTTRAGHDASTAAFADYCGRHELSLVWGGGPLGSYQVPPASAKDFELVACFLVFPPGTPKSKMDAAMPDIMEFPFNNETAGLSMCDPGLRGKGPMPADAYRRASAEIAKLLRLFREYDPAAKTGR